jgi:CrcB protein
MIWVAVAVGGALGSLARHAVTLVVARLNGPVVPTAVAIVNVVGCLVIGMLAGATLSGRWALSSSLRAFLVIGILGGFTTFSSFGLDTFMLVRDQRYVLAAINAVGQLLLGLGAVFAGYALVLGITR